MVLSRRQLIPTPLDLTIINPNSELPVIIVEQCNKWLTAELKELKAQCRILISKHERLTRLQNHLDNATQPSGYTSFKFEGCNTLPSSISDTRKTIMIGKQLALCLEFRTAIIELEMEELFEDRAQAVIAFNNRFEVPGAHESFKSMGIKLNVPNNFTNAFACLMTLISTSFKMSAVCYFFCL